MIPSTFGETSIERYEKRQKIGTGTYGIVYKALDTQTDKFIALKKILLDAEPEGIPSTAIREICILRELTHENIVRLLDVIATDDKLYLIFEFVDQDLKQYLNVATPLDPAVIKCFMHQMVSAVAFLHSKRILHRDLKPQNILVNRAGVVKLADFGLARAYQIPLRPYTHEVVTLWYRAPEILLGTLEYSAAIDVWSLGVIFAELLVNKPIFAGDSEIDQLYRIFRAFGTPNEASWPGVSRLKEFKKNFPNWKSVSLEEIVPGLDALGLDLLRKMLTCDPTSRITAREVMQHQYFDDVRNHTWR